MNMITAEHIYERLCEILNHDLLTAVYRLKYPYRKGEKLSGAHVGQSQFRPSIEYMQSYYDLVFHRALVPLSKIPMSTLLAADLTQCLPNPGASDYPEQCIGLITLLDQTRMITTGYNFRYTRSFFDPICEKLARQLTSLPLDKRPDGKAAWLSRGYSCDDWLIRTIWFWAPLVHSDTFMTADRQTLKKWLHYMRMECENHSGRSDPFAPLEPTDDVDILAFKRIETAGPPCKSYEDAGEEATVTDYAFWWIRILNSHFAITDMCGHYPYWIRWKGQEWTKRDREFMLKSDNFRYNPEDEPVLQEVRRDYLHGVWKPMSPNHKYEP